MYASPHARSSRALRSVGRQQLGDLGHEARGAGEDEHRPVAVEERGERRDGCRPPRAGRAPRRGDPVPRASAAARRWRSRISSAGRASRAFAYSRISPWSDVPAGVAGERLEEQATAREPVERPRRAVHARGLQQRAAEPVEVDGAGERVPHRPGRGGDHLLREVREQRSLGPLEPVEDGLAAAVGRGAQRLDRQADRGRPAVRRREDPRGGVRRSRRAARRSPGSRRGHEGLDLAHRERERARRRCPRPRPGPAAARRRTAGRCVTRAGRAGSRARTGRAPRRTARTRSRRRSRGSRRARGAARRRGRPGARPRRASPRPGRDGVPRPRPWRRRRWRWASRDPRAGPGRRRRSAATTPAANVPRCASIGSIVYQAAGRLRAIREARVLFPNPAPATMIVRRRSVPAVSRASSSGRSRVPLGSRGGTSFAARLTPTRRGRGGVLGRRPLRHRNAW